METSAVTQILRLLAKYSIIGFVVGHLLALGMRLTVQEILAPLRRLRLVVLALVANFVLGPVFAYLSAQLISLVIPLEHGYVIGLMIIGSAAGSPMLPKWVKLAKGDLGFGVALMVLLMGITIFYLPLVLPRLISGVDVEAWSVAQPLIMMILVPFIVGLLLKVRYPGVAAKLEPPLDRFSSVCLIVVIVAVVALYRESLISAVGEGAIGACHAIPGAVDGRRLSPGRPGCGHPTRARPRIRAAEHRGRALGGLHQFADPKVIVIAVIAALVILIVLLGMRSGSGIAPGLSATGNAPITSALLEDRMGYAESTFRVIAGISWSLYIKGDTKTAAIGSFANNGVIGSGVMRRDRKISLFLKPTLLPSCHCHSG